MFLDDALDDPAADERRAYEQGVRDCRDDRHTRQQVADLSRENFNRGHSAGFACGLVRAATAHLLASTPPQQLEPGVALELSEVHRIAQALIAEVDECLRPREAARGNVAASGAASAAEDEPDEDASGRKSAAARRRDRLLSSIREALVGLVDRFFAVVRVCRRSSGGVAGADRADDSALMRDPALLPESAWDFLEQLTLDNRDGSPLDPDRVRVADARGGGGRDGGDIPGVTSVAAADENAVEPPVRGRVGRGRGRGGGSGSASGGAALDW
jgi:hypothetical protein